MDRLLTCAAMVMAAGTLSGCAAPGRPPNLAEIYNQAARYHAERRNPVIVIPGILGSKLAQGGTGRVVWGAFGGGFADPRTADGARLLALPMRERAVFADLTDDVEPAGVLDRVRVDLLGLPLELNAYLNIILTLGAGGYRDQQLGEAGAIDYGPGHYSCFQFDYDWRRDNVENAKRLHAFLVSRREYVRKKYAEDLGLPNHEVKFDLVGHSMGGLIARYFLMYGDADLPADGSTPPVTWAGAALVDRAILIGTPNAGSVESFVELNRGAPFGAGLPKYDAAILGTMPSIYQLLPRPRHGAVVKADRPDQPVGDFFDAVLWESLGWGLADPANAGVLKQLLPDVPAEADRRRIALDHLRKCLTRAKQFDAALDTPAAPPEGLELFLFAGDAVPTGAIAEAGHGGKSVRVIKTAPGDGTVIRTSALMDERVGQPWQPKLVSPVAWKQVWFLFTDHLGMTKDPQFSDNVLYLLLEKPA